MIFFLTGCSTTTSSLNGLEEERTNQSSDTSLEEGALSNEEQRWIDQSCSRSLGPSLWQKCVQRETTALKSGVPDLSNLSIEDQNWIQSNCSRSLGPNLAIKCMRREKSAIEAGIPDISEFTHDQQAWLRQSCSKSLGPSLYRSCIIREGAALARSDSSEIKIPLNSEQLVNDNSHDPRWNCRALFGNEVVVKLAMNGETGFVTMLDQKYEGNYDTEGTTRIWYFGDLEESEYYRYIIKLDASGIANLFDMADAEKDGSVKSQETLSCGRN